jgi:hypothetical protein
MKHIQTIYKGIANCTTRAQPHSSELVRFSYLECHPYAPMISLLGSPLAKAQLYWQENILNKPYRVAVVVPSTADCKFKPSDPETMLDRILWLIDNMADPSCGAIVSVYTTDTIDNVFDATYSFNTLWHTKKLWTAGSDSRFITLQAHSEINHNSPNTGHRCFIEDYVSIVRYYAELLDYDVVEVDYSTPINELYNLMLNTKSHFSYVGSTGYFSGLTKTPTVWFGNMPNGLNTVQVHRHKTASLDAPLEEMIPFSVWNHNGTPGGHTLMYNCKHDKMYLDEPRYYTQAGNFDDFIQKVQKTLI